MKRSQNNYLIQAWLVLILSLLFGSALAGVQLSLSPTIERNKLNETLQKVPELISSSEQGVRIKEKLDIKAMTIPVGDKDTKRAYTLFKAVINKETAGWVVKTKGQGYADKIELLIGLDPTAKTITGLYVMNQKETPGLGSKISTKKWRTQFINKDTKKPLTVVKTKAQFPNEINAITGATISSRSVCRIINKAVSDLKKPLREAAKSKG